MEEHIPGNIINAFINEHIPKGVSISLKYKKALKKMVYLYLNYIMTISETLAEEKGMRNVDTLVVKEALESLEFYKILKNLEKFEEEKRLRRS